MPKLLYQHMVELNEKGLVKNLWIHTLASMRVTLLTGHYHQ